MRTIEYTVKVSQDAKQLADFVTAALNDGWTLAGNLVVETTDFFGGRSFYQPMTRHRYETPASIGAVQSTFKPQENQE